MKSPSAQTRILVTGGSGLIGQYVCAAPEIKKQAKLFAPTHQQLNTADTSAVKGLFTDFKPNIVIHLAAHRNATTAEEQRGDKKGSVWLSNVIGTKNIALAAQKHQAYLIHISTDYVFSGHESRPGPYQEDDVPEENDELLSWYGISKREAERVIQATLSEAAIIRINNVTQPKYIHHLDYIGKILWLFNQKKLYPLFNDQSITLTYIPLITKMMARLMKTRQTGVFHAASIDRCTPHQLANYLIQKYHSLDQAVVATSIDQYLHQSPRRYPKHGGLRTELTQEKLKLRFMSWQEIVDAFIDSIK
jgi:dTDP-4-dehydrorhamnose reductase